MQRVALDANLLLLFAVGMAGSLLLVRHKRLRQYDQACFQLLNRIIGAPEKLLISPNVMTEVSNLAPYGLSEHEAAKVRSSLAWLAEHAQERSVASRDATADQDFLRLGLTDAVLLRCSASGATLWTDDLDLYLSAAHRRLAVENFTHHRVAAGIL